MKTYGRGTLADFLVDRVVYRNLVPCDGRLPALTDLRQSLGLATEGVPRKSEPDYGRVMAGLLKAARALDLPGGNLSRLVFIGDTRLNDGTAFQNLARALNVPGIAFIGSENEQPASVETIPLSEGLNLVLSNRWAALDELDDRLRGQGIPFDEETAVIVDLDKTAIGARGRNAGVIDRARVTAVRLTVAFLLGDEFDEAAFRRVYDHLNQVEFHPFTGDNQDYLAYISLVLGGGFARLEELVAEVQSGRLNSFRQFIEQVDHRSQDLPEKLRSIHQGIYDRVLAGDPTPFKAFRHQEYRTTVASMGQLDDGTPVEVLLQEEILITREVRDAALRWLEAGALLFGLSDKPDEASLPLPELEAQGFAPLHRTQTHIVGT